jgi:F-type H+-transporting ATPase subunit b
MLDINTSLFVQIANFLVLLFVLNLLFYRPIRKILSKRSGEMDSLQQMVDDYVEKSAQREKGIEDSMVLARKEGFQEKEGLRGQGIEEEKGLLQEASSALEERVSTAKEEIDKKMADVRKALDEEVAVFSQELAQKILGRNV